MCGETCAQITLITFNLLFMVSGYGILTTGLYVRFRHTDMDDMMGSSLIITCTYIMMAAGGLVMMVSIAGFLGAVTKNRKILFVVSGYGILTTGLYVRFRHTDMDDMMGSSLIITCTYIMMAAGGLVMMVSIAGFLGAVTKNRKILFVVSGYGILTTGLYVRFRHTDMDDMMGSSLIITCTYIMMAAGGLVMMVSIAGFLGAVTKNRKILFVVSGYGILTTGLYVRFRHTDMDDMMGSSLIITCTYIMMAAGGLVMMVSIAGFLGAVTKNRKILFVYSLLLILTFLIEAAAGILGFICHDKAKEFLDEEVKPVILNKYGYEHHKMLSTGIDLIQQELRCCGYEDSLDWSRSAYYTDTSPEIVAARGSSKLPVSCCININKQGCNDNFDSDIFQQSCYKKLENLIQDNLKILGAVGIGVCFLQLLGVVLSVLLIKKSKEEELDF